MKFKCSHCGQIINRDMRNKLNKSQLTKRGYRSYCDKAGKVSYCKPVK